VRHTLSAAVCASSWCRDCSALPRLEKTRWTDRTDSLIAVAALALPLLGQEWRFITNSREHYKIAIPRAWIAWPVDDTGVMYASTFARSQALSGGLVPRGHAAISIIPQGKASMDLNSWIDARLKELGEAERKKITFNDSEPHADVKSYIRVAGRDEVGPGSYYRTVDDYFTLNGRSFVMKLEFKERDSRESTYQAALDRAIRTFTVVPK
jgi:hypothetical protein